MTRVPPKMMKGLLLKPEHMDKLRFPLWTSVKYDGVCVRFWQGKAWSPAGKLYRNPWVQDLAMMHRVRLKQPNYAIDSEFIIEDYTPQQIAGLLNRRKYTQPPGRFYSRFAVFSMGDMHPQQLMDIRDAHKDGWFRLRTEHMDGDVCFEIITQSLIENKEMLHSRMRHLREIKSEGIMLRRYDGAYVVGKRSTIKDQRLMKIKFKIDFRARVIGFEPLKTNHNPQTIDAYGLAKRSSEQDFKESDHTRVGSLLMQALDGPHHMQIFSAGTGLTDKQRMYLMQKFDSALGLVDYTAEIEAMPQIGEDKPRQPVIKRLFDPWNNEIEA